MDVMSFGDDLRRFGPGTSMRVSREEAIAYCANLTASHYENFSVVTWLTPRALRPAFQSIYAFCRWSDDLADEVGSTERSLELLESRPQRAGRQPGNDAEVFVMRRRQV